MGSPKHRQCRGVVAAARSLQGRAASLVRDLGGSGARALRACRCRAACLRNLPARSTPSSALCLAARLHFVFTHAGHATPVELGNPCAQQPGGLPREGFSARRPLPVPMPVPVPLPGALPAQRGRAARGDPAAAGTRPNWGSGRLGEPGGAAPGRAPAASPPPPLRCRRCARTRGGSGAGAGAGARRWRGARGSPRRVAGRRGRRKRPLARANGGAALLPGRSGRPRPPAQRAPDTGGRPPRGSAAPGARPSTEPPRTCPSGARPAATCRGGRGRRLNGLLTAF